MAVVSEPPWLNFASGTAARNGTTSHTINFGFTSTSGSLLVVIMHGAVTHTVSGWTEQAQPVSSGELSLFTKTSAGDSSITATHNGSNYPVNWVAYEFPAGSTLTGIDSTTGSNDTMPGLTGLPGTEQVVIAALGRVTVGSETGGSIAPSAPWVEDADLFTAASGTDGTYLAVIRQINVTATSITPTISPTYSGTWGNAAREKISAAFDVAASGSTINGTATIAGAGSVTAAAVQAATATATGAGSITALSAQQAGATVAGLGAASAAVVQRATATVTGAGSVAANTSGATSGTASVAGAGSVTALARQGSTAAASGVGSVSAAGIVIVPGTATVAGSGGVTALARLGATTTVAGSGSVTASAGLVILGAAAVMGVGSVTATSGSRITPRPNSGITARPNTGTTVRP